MLTELVLLCVCVKPRGVRVHAALSDPCAARVFNRSGAEGRHMAAPTYR